MFENSLQNQSLKQIITHSLYGNVHSGPEMCIMLHKFT